ncbi:MAG: hypothetical protein HRT35_11615 [Algicola sp.]|nr:hypothetical protein [Algicola sp.]
METPAIDQPQQSAADQAVAETTQNSIQPSGAGEPAQLVYALGLISYDIIKEPRGHSLKATGTNLPEDPDDPYDPYKHQKFLTHLEQSPYDAASVTWVLTQQETPVYAIQPAGPFAAHAYEKLREFLALQHAKDVQQVTIPGYLTGDTVTLRNSHVVPVITPDIRGMYSWNIPELVKTLLKDMSDDTEYKTQSDAIKNFLERVFYEIRSPGVAPQDRAINHAATRAFQLKYIFSEALKDGLKLESIGVERSPSCPPGSDCWDVKLVFFHPKHRLERAKNLFALTIDVNDVVPVLMGDVRDWQQY